MPLQMFDTLSMDDGAKTRFTSDGYLVAAPRVARTGIQLYSGAEVGKPDVKVVKVFRPEAEVFDRDSLHSYAHKPFTNDHPKDPVNSETWKTVAVGDLGEDVVRDGDFVRVPLVMMDKTAIDDYRSGKKELSLGYTCDLQFIPGTTPNGETYDAVQTNIRANHLALVKAARGGSDLRVGDENPQEMNTMTTQTVMVDGAALQVDTVSASVINAHLGRLSSNIESLKGKLDESDKKVKKGETDAATVATETKTAMDKIMAENATLKKQIEDAKMTPAAIDKMVIDRATVVTACKKVLGDKLVIDGKTDADMRRQVVDSVMKEAAKGWSDEAVTASFNTIVAAGTTTAKDTTKGGTSFEDVRKSFAFGADTNLNDADKAYADMSKHLTDAWKTPAAA